MQKLVLCILAVIAMALAAPQQSQEQKAPVTILKQDADVNPEGYVFDFLTSDGTSRQEHGTLKDLGKGVKAIEVSGSYKYVAPDGVIYTVTYTADEEGFKPQEHVSSQ